MYVVVQNFQTKVKEKFEPQHVTTCMHMYFVCFDSLLFIILNIAMFYQLVSLETDKRKQFPLGR